MGVGLFSWLASSEKGEKKPHPPGAFREEPLYLVSLFHIFPDSYGTGLKMKLPTKLVVIYLLRLISYLRVITQQIIAHMNQCGTNRFAALNWFVSR